jgi:multidrug efflux pump subunit AcrB
VMDWNEPACVITVNILQDQARHLGIPASDIAVALNAFMMASVYPRQNARPDRLQTAGTPAMELASHSTETRSMLNTAYAVGLP